MEVKNSKELITKKRAKGDPVPTFLQCFYNNEFGGGGRSGPKNPTDNNEMEHLASQVKKTVESKTASDCNDHALRPTCSKAKLS